MNNLVVLDYKTHPSAFYTSRLLDFKNLPEPQNSKEINEQFYSQSQSQAIDFINLSIEENQEVEQVAQVIQSAYGTPGSSKPK